MKVILRFTLAIISVPVLFSISSWADTAKVCDDLFKFSCAPGSFDDGTGAAQRPMDGQFNPLMESLNKKAKALLRAELEKPDASYFRKIVLSGTGLAAAPQCDTGVDAPTADCLDRMSEGAAELQMRFLKTPAPRPSQEEITHRKIKDIYYLLESDQFNTIKKSLLEEAGKSNQSDQLNKKIENEIFPKVRTLLISQISRLVADPEIQKKLIDKVRAITFKGQDCSGDSIEKKTIASVLVANAFYNPGNNSFKYCAGFNASSTSEFTMAFVIAHELAHSIDPCGITTGPSDFSFAYRANISVVQAHDQYPVGNILNCLRQKNSVAAIAALSNLGYGVGSYGTTNAQFGVDPRGMSMSDTTNPYAAYGAQRPNNGPSQPPFKSFCDKDQITEAFSDWMAMEITPEYIEKNHPTLTTQQLRLGYSNMFRPLCSAYEQQGYDDHPPTELRTNAIALVQPKIRAQMGCSASPANYIYCPPEGPPKLEGRGGFGDMPDSPTSPTTTTPAKGRIPARKKETDTSPTGATP